MPATIRPLENAARAKVAADAELRETIRQALADWNAATPEQREKALAAAEAAADRRERALLENVS